MANIAIYLSLILTTFLWGGTFVAGRMLAANVDPATAAFLRFVVASAVMLVIVRFAEGKFTIPPVRTWFPLLLLGATGVFAYNVFFFHGLQHIGAGRASLIIASTPLTITLLAAIFTGERLTGIKITGILISLTGAVLVISNGHPSTFLHGGFGPGERALVGCVLSWAAYTLIGRAVLQTLSPLRSVCYSSIIGTLLLAIPAISHGFMTKIARLECIDWVNISYLGILGTALGFSLYYYGIKKIGTVRSGIFINLVPVFSLVLSWTILGETLRPAVLAGGGLVLAGIALTNLRRSL